MKAICTVLGVALALALGARLAADDTKNADEKGVGQSAQLQDLNLTDEQEAKIKEIRNSCRPKVDEAAKDLGSVVKEEMDKVNAVLTSEQREKLAALKDERETRRFDGLAQRLCNLKSLDLTDAEMAQIATVRDEFRPKIEAALTGMHGILTADQKKMREEGLKAGKSRREIRETLNLTDDQKTKFEGVCKEVCGLVRDEMSKIKDCLSDSQQAKLSELKDERREHARDRWASRVANLQELNLTEDQKKQIGDIRTEYRPKVHEAGNKLRAAVREEVSMILDAIKS